MLYYLNASFTFSFFLLKTPNKNLNECKFPLPNIIRHRINQMKMVAMKKTINNCGDLMMQTRVTESTCDQNYLD